ncbi:MAG: NAD(P)-dependent alcohol dehydrogenase, partial [Cyanobacteria bacterium J06628_6]
MKALVYIQYGPPDVLQLKEVEKPLPGDDEVLIRVQATTVNRTDCATIRAKPFFMRLVTGLFKPKQQIPGTAFAGEVESVGKGVVSLNVGDKVFGSNDQGAGCHAQYMTIKADKAVILPDKISYEQAAACPEGMHYAYNFINKVDLEKGQQVLVNGATGAIGSAAVQLLKDLGVQVTAVCSTPHINLVKSLGADRVIDYTKEDFTKDAQKYDFVFDTVGKSSFFECKSLLNPGGVYISSDLGELAQNLFLPIITSIVKPLIGGKKTVFPTPVDISGSLHLLKRLIEQGKFKAVIDKELPLEDIVEAYKYVEKGHKIGNVVITVKHRGIMTPTIVRRASFTVLGVVAQVRQSSETPEMFADIWQQFESRRHEIESLATGTHYFG